MDASRTRALRLAALACCLAFVSGCSGSGSSSKTEKPTTQAAVPATTRR
jgi:hypothetical protein